MALTQLTKIDGRGINTTSDYRVGILTAIKFVGPFDGTGGNFAGVVTATNGVFSGNVTIGGTLTYEDVTNIDSVGIITARNGIDCNGDLDVDGHTNLDNVNIAGVTTGTIFKVPDATNAAGATNHIAVGDNSDLKLYHDNNGDAYVSNATGHLTIRNNTSGKIINLQPKSGANGIIARYEGAAELYYNGTKRLETTSAGVVINGAAWLENNGSNLEANGLGINASIFHNGDTDTAMDFAGSNDQINFRTAATVRATIQNTGLSVIGIMSASNANISGDIDVDGHTNLDNVSVSGVTTFSEDVIFNGANFDITYDRSVNTLNFDQSFLKFGTSGQFVFRSSGAYSTIDSTAGLKMTVGSLQVLQTSGDKMIKTYNNGAVELYHDDNLRLTTSTKGIQVGTGVTIETNGQATFTGIVTASTYYGDGSNLTGIVADKIFEGNTEVETVDTGSDGHIKFTTDGTPQARFDNAGNLLMGKTSTSYTVDGTRVDKAGMICLTKSSTSTILATANGGNLNLINANATDNNFSNIGGYNSNGLVTSQIDFVNVSHSSRHGALAFLVHNGSSMPEMMRITKDAKIGMGLVSTSGSKCDPDGNGLLIRAASTVGTKNGHIMLTGDGATNGEGPQIVFSESGSGANWAGGAIGFKRTGGSGVGALVFGTRATSGDANTVPTERMRIGLNGGTMIQNAGTLVTTTNETLYVQGEGHNGHGTTNTRSVVSISGAITSNTSSAGIWIGARTDSNTAVIGTRTSTGNLAFETYSGGWGERMRLTYNGSLNIGGDYSQSTYTMKVTGSFAATTKSFVIDHPTKENHSLRYACLEGPENSVYVRGKTSESVIELPDYWKGLVHEDSITVNVTPIGNYKVWVEAINNNSVTIGSDGSEYFYTVFAERKDVDKLEVEVAK